MDAMWVIVTCIVGSLIFYVAANAVWVVVMLWKLARGDFGDPTDLN